MNGGDPAHAVVRVPTIEDPTTATPMGSKASTWASALIGLLCWSAAVMADEGPQVRINDPFAAGVWRTGLSGDGTTLVAGLSSGALAVWQTAELGPPRLLHLPVRTEEARRARPVALHPTSPLIAIGVPPLRDAHGLPILKTARIYLVDSRSSRILRVLDDVASRAQDLKFSPDGRYLAAALSGGCGIRIWRTDDWQTHAVDDAGYGGPPASAGSRCGADQSREADTLGIAFAPAGPVWLVSSGRTGVRIYGSGQGRLTPLQHATPESLGLAVPDGLSVSPDGEWLAIGDRRLRKPQGRPALAPTVVRLQTLAPASVRVTLQDADLQFPDRLNPDKFADASQFNLSRVAWTTVGTEPWILAAGTFPCIAAPRERIVLDHPGTVGPLELCAVGWNVASRGENRPAAFFPVGTEQINDLSASMTPGIWVAASDRAINRYARRRGESPPSPSADGAAGWRRSQRTALGADLRNRSGWGADTLQFDVSSDATEIRLQTYPDVFGQSHRIAFDLRHLTLAPAGRGVLHAPRSSAAGLLAPRDWTNTSNPPVRVGGDPAGAAWDIYRAATVLPQGQVVVGSANFLTLYSSDGDRARTRCALRIPAEAYRLNASDDGSILVAAHGDGTLRWYRVLFNAAGDCRLHPRVAVHLRKDSRDNEWHWMAWVPDTGEFASDPLVRDLVSWQLAQPPCETGLVGFGSLARDLYDRRAVETAIDRAGDDSTLPGLLDNHCSAFKALVKKPTVRAKVNAKVIPFEIEVSGLRGRPGAMSVSLGSAERMAVSMNGRRYAPDETIPLQHEGVYSLSAEMPDRTPATGTDFQVCFQVQQERDCHLLVWTGAAPAPASRKLWAVFTGISNYGMKGSDDARSLQFAQNDVVDLAHLFIQDHRQQQTRPSGRGVDFEALSLRLFLAPLDTPQSKSEIQTLGQVAAIALAEPLASRIYGALDELADRIHREGSPEDLFIFYFSGHGLATPDQQVKGSSVLLLPASPGGRRFDSGSEDFLDSAMLLARLSHIEARKVVVIDACRNLPRASRAPAFDAGKMSQEFAAAVPSAHIFFGTKDASGSIETNRYVFDATRPIDHRGNGLFSYAFLSGLVAPRKVGQPESFDRIEQVSVGDIWSFIKKSFNEGRMADATTFSQRPTYIPGREVEPLFLRSADFIADRPGTAP